jgi:transcriptional regulator with XRE-family HTH domain
MVTIAEFTPKLRHRIAMAIDEAGLTQKEVADRMGVSQPVISRWVKGHRIPDALEIVRLSEATGCEWLSDLRGLPLRWKNEVAGQSMCAA